MASDFEFRHPILRNDEHSPLNELKKKKTPKNKQKMLSTVQLLITNSDKSKDKNKMGVKILFLIKKTHLLSKI